MNYSTCHAVHLSAFVLFDYMTREANPSCNRYRQGRHTVALRHMRIGASSSASAPQQQRRFCSSNPYHNTTMKASQSLRLTSRQARARALVPAEARCFSVSSRAQLSRRTSTAPQPSPIASPILNQRPRSAHIQPQTHRNASSSASESQPLKKTALHDLHTANGGTMVPFAGYSMPVQYSDLGVGDSHRWTREKASLFDVSHMYISRIFSEKTAYTTVLNAMTFDAEKLTSA